MHTITFLGTRDVALNRSLTEKFSIVSFDLAEVKFPEMCGYRDIKVLSCQAINTGKLYALANEYVATFLAMEHAAYDSKARNMLCSLERKLFGKLTSLIKKQCKSPGLIITQGDMYKIASEIYNAKEKQEVEKEVKKLTSYEEKYCLYRLSYSITYYSLPGVPPPAPASQVSQN